MQKLIIFDLDGTLLYTLLDLKEACNYALKLNGYPLISLEQTRTYVGNGIKRLIELASEEKDELKIEKLLSDFKNYYKLHTYDHTKVYDGILETLIKLKQLNYKTVICTNKVDDAAKVLKEKYFGDLIDEAYGETSLFKRKPDKDIIEHILDVYHVNKEDCLYIGDSEVDVKTCINAEIECLVCLWGFRTKEELDAQFDNLQYINEPKEILNHLLCK